MISVIPVSYFRRRYYPRRKICPSARVYLFVYGRGFLCFGSHRLFGISYFFGKDELEMKA